MPLISKPAHPSWMPSWLGDTLDQALPVAGFEAPIAKSLGQPAVDLTATAVKRALGPDFFSKLPEQVKSYLTSVALPTETRMQELLAKMGGAKK